MCLEFFNTIGLTSPPVGSSYKSGSTPFLLRDYALFPSYKLMLNYVQEGCYLICWHFLTYLTVSCSLIQRCFHYTRKKLERAPFYLNTRPLQAPIPNSLKVTATAFMLSVLHMYHRVFLSLAAYGLARETTQLDKVIPKSFEAKEVRPTWKKRFQQWTQGLLRYQQLCS